MSLMNWIRSRFFGTVKVPPGHKVVVMSPTARSAFVRLESGLRLAEFGQTLEYRSLFDAAERDLRLAPGLSIVWSLQERPVMGWTSDESLLADWLWRFHQVRQIRGTEAGDVAVVPDFGPPARAMMALLASLKIGVHLPGPKGEILVEVHRPDGIVIGMPGPAVRGGKAPLLWDLYSARMELQGTAGTEDGIEENKSQERALIRRILQEAHETGAAGLLDLPPNMKEGYAPGRAAPLSDLMDRGETDLQAYSKFLEEFRLSMLGVMATGAPEETEGPFQSTDENPIILGSSEDAEGRSVLLAFADPEAFAQRFGRHFNAELSGEALLQTVLMDRDCWGIRVNSAKREMSVIIDRDTAQRLLRAR